MAQTKQTKKFESRHLKDTLKKRKEFAKIKQRHQVNDKRKAKNAQTKAEEERDAAEQPGQKKVKQDEDKFQDMSVDDFFAGGFEVPEQPKTKSNASKDKKPDLKRKREDGEESDVSEDEQEDDNAVGAHVGDLKALAKKDPEFYKYLQENDAELLDFAETADLEEVDDLSGSDDNDDDSTDRQRKNKKSKVGEQGSEISRSTVQKWTKAMVEQHSLRAMREVVLAFRAAAHLNEEEGKQYKYTISNADVYHEVLIGALRHIPTVLAHHLPVKQLPNGKMRIPLDTKKFRTLTKLLTSHTVSLQHLLANLSDTSTIKLTLTSILDLLPYILSFKKAVKSLIGSVVTIWASPAQDEALRISAFLILRRLSQIADPGLKESLLRTTYQGLIKSARTTTVHNISGINLMKNTALELWGLVDPNIAYTTAFTFIRQLAIHLRTCIKNNSNDAYKAVYNWQYTHSLDFWSRVLSTHCETLTEAKAGKQSPLRPLIYPLTQVTLGAMRLIPTSAYFPLRFHLIRSLLRLSNATGTFIPLAAPLYEVLSSAEMKKAPKPSTLKALDFETNIRASKAYLRTRVYQDGVGEQVAELLGDFFTLWCKSIAFPELALPVIVVLRRWLKEVSPWAGSGSAPNGGANGNGSGANRLRRGAKGKKDDTSKGNRNAKVNGAIVLLVQKLEANAKFIEEKRAKVEFAPNDRSGVEGFLKEFEIGKTPLGAFVDGQRKQRDERRRIVEQGRRDEESKREKGRVKEARKGGEEVVEDVDDEESDGDGMDVEDEDGELEGQSDGENEDEDELEIDEEEERELDDDEIELIES